MKKCYEFRSFNRDGGINVYLLAVSIIILGILGIFVVKKSMEKVQTTINQYVES